MSRGYYNNPIDGGEHVRDFISEYLDGTLPGDRRDAVRAHLEECADCRADYVELRATQKLMRSMPAVAAPRAFTLTPEMAATVRKPSLWDRFFSPRNAPRLATGSVVAFLLLFIFLTSDLLVSTNNVASPSAAFSKTGSGLSSGSEANEQSAPQRASDTDTAMAEATATTGMAAAPSGDGANSAGTEAGPPVTGGAAQGTSPSGATAATPNTEITTSGNSSPTTTTLHSPSPEGDETTTTFTKIAPPGAHTEATPASPADNGHTGFVALQVGLLGLGLGLGVAAFIARRRA